MAAGAAPEGRRGGRCAAGPCGKGRARLLVAAAAMLMLVSCAMRPPGSPTPARPTPKTERTRATARISASETPRTATLTRQPPTATATARAVSATPVPPSSTWTPSPPPATTTTTPTARPSTPTASPSPLAPQVVIHTFRANVEVADPGDTITLTWRWSGGEGATIYHIFPTGQLSEPYWDVGPAGSLEYTISPQRRNSDMFALFVHDEEGVAAQDMVEVALRCPDEWFFSPAPDICPAGPPLISRGAEEHFERGTMLWVGAEGRIYVLFDDERHRRWSAYTDEWDEGKPSMNPEIDPPPGLQQPVRGFGLLWREEPRLRERLGWAVDEEREYETAVQRTSHVRYPVLYIRALDGGAWELGPNGSAWEHVAAASGG